LPIVSVASVRRWKSWLVGAAGVCVSAISGVALGGPAESPLPMAQALFEEGRTLMAEGRLTEACDKLSESQRLDPASGTLLNLAVCHEKQGKTATAWAEYKNVAALAGREHNAERERLATLRIRDVEPKLSRFSLVPADTFVGRALTVKIDGTIFREAAWKTAMPIDPGAHHVEIQLAEGHTWSGTLTVAAAAEPLMIVVVDDRRVVERRSPAPEPGSAHAAGAAARRRRLPYELGAASALALGAGTYLGLQAKSEWDERNAHCPGGACDAVAVRAATQARRYAVATDAAMAVGLVGLGFTTYFAITALAPARQEPAVELRATRDSFELTWGGRF
jgi:hypothetical protein